MIFKLIVRLFLILIFPLRLIIGLTYLATNLKILKPAIRFFAIIDLKIYELGLAIRLRQVKEALACNQYKKAIQICKEAYYSDERIISIITGYRNDGIDIELSDTAISHRLELMKLKPFDCEAY